MLVIRPALPSDSDAIWSILEPILRAGETYTLPRDITRDAAFSFWFSPAHEVFVALDDGRIVGTYFLRPNQNGGGSHVVNCGYMTAPAASGRGVARAMCAHSLDHARNRGFRAMQFNFVVSTKLFPSPPRIAPFRDLRLPRYSAYVPIYILWKNDNLVSSLAQRGICFSPKSNDHLRPSKRR